MIEGKARVKFEDVLKLWGMSKNDEEKAGIHWPNRAVVMFCHDFQNTQCMRKMCNYTHGTLKQQREWEQNKEQSAGIKMDEKSEGGKPKKATRAEGEIPSGGCGIARHQREGKN